MIMNTRQNKKALVLNNGVQLMDLQTLVKAVLPEVRFPGGIIQNNLNGIVKYDQANGTFCIVIDISNPQNGQVQQWLSYDQVEVAKAVLDANINPDYLIALPMSMQSTEVNKVMSAVGTEDLPFCNLGGIQDEPISAASLNPDSFYYVKTKDGGIGTKVDYSVDMLISTMNAIAMSPMAMTSKQNAATLIANGLDRANYALNLIKGDALKVKDYRTLALENFIHYLLSVNKDFVWNAMTGYEQYVQQEMTANIQGGKANLVPMTLQSPSATADLLLTDHKSLRLAVKETADILKENPGVRPRNTLDIAFIKDFVSTIANPQQHPGMTSELTNSFIYLDDTIVNGARLVGAMNKFAKKELKSLDGTMFKMIDKDSSGIYDSKEAHIMKFTQHLLQYAPNAAGAISEITKSFLNPVNPTPGYFDSTAQYNPAVPSTSAFSDLAQQLGIVQQPQVQVPAVGPTAPAVNYNPQPQGGTNMYNFIQNPGQQYYAQPGMMQPGAPAVGPQLVVQPGAYNVNPGMPATAPQYYNQPQAPMMNPMMPAAAPQYYPQPAMAPQYVQQPMMNPMMPATAPQYFQQQMMQPGLPQQQGLDFSKFQKFGNQLWMKNNSGNFEVINDPNLINAYNAWASGMQPQGYPQAPMMNPMMQAAAPQYYQQPGMMNPMQAMYPQPMQYAQPPVQQPLSVLGFRV